jgi:hypothetical protein
MAKAFHGIIIWMPLHGFMSIAVKPTLGSNVKLEIDRTVIAMLDIRVYIHSLQ